MLKNKIDFNKRMIVLGEENRNAKVLLHSCCAPCSTACIERLKNYFNVEIFYYNPNMDSEEEYLLRKAEQEKYCNKINIKCYALDYNAEDFYSNISGLEGEFEGGKRCEKCFYIRLKKTAEFAKDNGFMYFCTTLTVSPLKNATLINQIGERVASEVGIKYLPSDFKKENGYKRSIEISKENNMYRQNYCGCKFSKAQREKDCK